MEFEISTNSDSTRTLKYSIRIDFHDIPDTEETTDNDSGLSGNKDYLETGNFYLYLIIHTTYRISFDNIIIN